MSEIVTPQSAAVSRGEICRKILHMTPGLLPFLFPLIEHPDPLDWRGVWIIVTICVVLTALYVGLRNVVQRPEETNFWSTTLSYPVIMIVTLVLFRHNTEFLCVAVVVLALGDGAAYVGGKSFGRRRLPWNLQKTWAGMVSFVLCAGPVASMVYWIEARPTVAFWQAAACGMAAALAGALAETAPTDFTDNARVGLAATLAVVAMHSLLFGWPVIG